MPLVLRPLLLLLLALPGLVLPQGLTLAACLCIAGGSTEQAGEACALEGCQACACCGNAHSEDRPGEQAPYSQDDACPGCQELNLEEGLPAIEPGNAGPSLAVLRPVQNETLRAPPQAAADRRWRPDAGRALVARAGLPGVLPLRI